MNNVDDNLSFLNVSAESGKNEKPLNELDTIIAQTKQEQIQENRQNPRHLVPPEMVCRACAHATVLVESGAIENGVSLLVHCAKLHGLVLGGEHISNHITACSSLQRIELPPRDQEQEG